MGARKPIPRESTKDTVKTVAQGRPGHPAVPVVPAPCISFARGPRASEVRPSLRPLIERDMIDASPGHAVLRDMRACRLGECLDDACRALDAGDEGADQLLTVVLDKRAARAPIRDP